MQKRKIEKIKCKMRKKKKRKKRKSRHKHQEKNEVKISSHLCCSRANEGVPTCTSCYICMYVTVSPIR